MLTLGPFLVAKDGTLCPRANGIRPVLRFAWRGRGCVAEVTPQGLRLTALVGRIPSTIERRGNRIAVMQAVSAMRGGPSRGLSVHLLPDHRLLLRRQACAASDGAPPDSAPPDSAPPEASPLVATSLVTEMVRFVFALDPFLDQLDAAGAPAPMTMRSGAMESLRA